MSATVLLWKSHHWIQTVLCSIRDGYAFEGFVAVCQTLGGTCFPSLSVLRFVSGAVVKAVVACFLPHARDFITCNILNNWQSKSCEDILSPNPDVAYLITDAWAHGATTRRREHKQEMLYWWPVPRNQFHVGRLCCKHVPFCMTLYRLCVRHCRHRFG